MLIQIGIIPSAEDKLIDEKGQSTPELVRVITRKKVNNILKDSW